MKDGCYAGCCFLAEKTRRAPPRLSLRSMSGAPNREFGDGPFEFLLRDMMPEGRASASAAGGPVEVCRNSAGEAHGLREEW